MNEVKWADDLSVGSELIDEQHKMLIQHLNNLAQAVEQRHGPAKIQETLEFLIDYTDIHFSDEEKHMATYNYPELESHKILHAEFKTTLSDIERDFLEDGPTHELAAAIDTLLVNWLLKHIKNVDVEFGTFLVNNGIELTEGS